VFLSSLWDTVANRVDSGEKLSVERQIKESYISFLDFNHIEFLKAGWWTGNLVRKVTFISNNYSGLNNFKMQTLIIPRTAFILDFYTWT